MLLQLFPTFPSYFFGSYLISRQPQEEMWKEKNMP